MKWKQTYEPGLKENYVEIHAGEYLQNKAFECKSEYEDKSHAKK